MKLQNFLQFFCGRPCTDGAGGCQGWRRFDKSAWTCLSLKKVDSLYLTTMSKLNQEKYYNEVVRLYFDEGYGSMRITHLVPVSRSTILRWIRNFVAENPEYRYQMQKASTPKHEEHAAIKRQEKATQEEIKALKEELGRLQVKLKKAELRADLYDEMINVAEKQFNIPIRKKVGAKR